MDVVGSADPNRPGGSAGLDGSGGLLEAGSTVRLVFEPGALVRLGALARELGCRRALLVTDRGIVAAGHAGRAQDSLLAAGVETTVFDAVHENPTARDVETCLAVARTAGIDLFVGLGGGSSMDTAKGCNFLLTNGGSMRDYWGVGKATQPLLPLIAVPTTAGTGSECQSFALIADDETHQKMACGDPKAAARVAILDPCLTLSQPRRVTACTGIDAIAHAVETAVCRKRSDISWHYSCEAFRLTAGNFERVLEEPADLEARAAMQLGAAYAGIAIENSMLGAAHAAANPLTARWDIVHGMAVGWMLPHVVRFNAQDADACEQYRQLAVSGGLVGPGEGPARAATVLADRLQGLVQAAGLGVSEAAFGALGPPGLDALDGLARVAATQWTAGFNPRSIGIDEFLGLYQRALSANQGERRCSFTV
jgi:alcohol dehydrogenase